LSDFLGSPVDTNINISMLCHCSSCNISICRPSTCEVSRLTELVRHSVCIDKAALGFCVNDMCCIMYYMYHGKCCVILIFHNAVLSFLLLMLIIVVILQPQF